jgi:hypothetical protein
MMAPSLPGSRAWVGTRWASATRRQRIEQEESMTATEPSDAQPISWRELTADTPVTSSDGETVGRVSEVLGSQEEDIFHGLEVHLARFGHRVLVTADQVAGITTAGVTLALTSEEVHALPEHTEERAFELGWTGLFRKHLGWVKERDWRD